MMEMEKYILKFRSTFLVVSFSHIKSKSGNVNSLSWRAGSLFDDSLSLKFQPS